MDRTSASPAGSPSVATPERTRIIRWDDPLAAAAAGASMRGIDYLRAIAAGKIPAPPIAQLIGMEIDEIEEGRVVFAATPDEYHYNPIGVAHGGLAATLLDSAMGFAIHSLLPQGRAYTTLEIKVNFIRSLTRETGRVRAVGTAIHVGGRTAIAEGRIIDADGELYAHATTTCILLGERPAAR